MQSVAVYGRNFYLAFHRAVADDDVEYRQHLETRFFWSAYLCLCTVIGGAGWSIHSVERIEGEFGIVRKTFVMFQYRIMVLSVVVLATSLVKHRLGRLRFISQENIVIGFACIWAVLRCWSNPWHLAKRLGVEPDLVFPAWDIGGSEGGMMLVVGATAITFGLVFPVRAKSAPIVPVVCLLSLASVVAASGVKHPGYVPENLAILSMSCVLSVRAAYFADNHNRQAWQVKRHAAKQQGLFERVDSGVTRILNILCDCVIHLGADFTLLEPSPRLAAMLLRTDELTMQGASFCELIVEEDQNRFMEAVRSSTVDENASAMVRVSLGDAHRRPFLVKAYHTCMRDSDGELGYLVGLIEPDENEGFQFSQAALHSNSYLQNAAHVPAGTDLEIPINVNSDLTDSYCAGSCDESSAAMSESARVGFTFVDDHHLTIVSATPGFTALCGGFAGSTRLLDIVKDQHQVLAWSQLIGNCVDAMLTVILQSPSSKRIGVTHAAQVTLDRVSRGCHLQQEEHADKLLFKVTLQNIRTRKGHNKKSTPRSSEVQAALLTNTSTRSTEGQAACTIGRVQGKSRRLVTL